MDIDEHVHSGFWNISTPELKAFLVKQGERPTDYMGWTLDLLGKEGVLEEGEKLILAGKARRRNTADFRLNIPAKKILYVEPLNERGVYFTDDPYV